MVRGLPKTFLEYRHLESSGHTNFFFQNPEFILKHFPGPYEKSFKNPLDSASSNPFNPLISYQFYQKASLKLKIFSDILRPEFDPFKTRINRKLTVTAQNGR